MTEGLAQTVRLPSEWTKEVYEKSVSSGCWWYTPYDKGDPGHWDAVSEDAEMREIVAMEHALGEVPDWARGVGIGYLPPCGHYTFPAPVLQVLDLIGAASQLEVERTFKIRCYTADRQRKRTAQDCCLCLDAWLAGAGPEGPAAELTARGQCRIDWSAACTGLWDTLGERSEKKSLLVERTLIAIRRAVKTFRWEDDRAAEFGRDEYLGDFHQSGGTSFGWGPSPRVDAIETRLQALDPGWRALFKVDLGGWWLCAPNAFRLLEYDLWAIGQDRPPRKGEVIPKFLQSDSTCPSREEAAVWWPQLLAALAQWWQGHPGRTPVAEDVNQRLGEATPVKRWLVRLYLRRLRMLARAIIYLTNPPRHDRLSSL